MVTEFHHLQLVAMQQSDVDEVIGIEESVYMYPWSRTNFTDSLANQYDAWVLRGIDGGLIGYFVLMQVVDESHLLTIAVKQSEQRRGIGQFLLGKVVERSRQLAMKSVVLEVRVSNLRACQLYVKFGFTEIGRRRNYYKVSSLEREDALIMQFPVSE